MLLIDTKLIHFFINFYFLPTKLNSSNFFKQCFRDGKLTFFTLNSIYEINLYFLRRGNKVNSSFRLSKLTGKCERSVDQDGKELNIF